MGQTFRRLSLFAKLRKVVAAFLLACGGMLSPTGGYAQASAPAYAFSHLAGPLGGPGNVDGTGASARFYYPTSVATDTSGNIFVADSANSVIRKISAGGVVTTYAGKAGVVGAADGAASDARFNGACGVAVDKLGNVYVADTGNNTIRKISPQGIVTTLAGASGSAYPGYADGVGGVVQFNYPTGIAVDSAGNLYVADFGNYVIRKITPAGAVSLFAGLPIIAGSQDSPTSAGFSATFASPVSVAVDGAGYVYVADTDNNTIRKISPTNVVSTLAGTAGLSGNIDGTAGNARFNKPEGIAVDNAGVLYVSDQSNHTIRKITASGVVTTVAGSIGLPGVADGTATAAQFNSPAGLAVDGTGNIYVADYQSDTIRKITPSGAVSTLAGNPSQLGVADGVGTMARFAFPAGVVADGLGNLYVADLFAGQIRKITSAGIVTTLPGDNIFGLPPGSRQWYSVFSVGIALDAAGNVYITDPINSTIRKITPAGTNTVIAGTSGVWGSADGVGASARFNAPDGLVIDGSGNLFVSDAYNYAIRKITAAGEVSTFAGQATVTGAADGTGTAASFGNVGCLAIDATGNLFVTDISHRTIRKVTPGATVTTLATLGGGELDTIGGLTVDKSGNVYVAVGGTIEKITSSGVVTTIGGVLGQYGSADGAGTAANFMVSYGLTVDPSDNLYAADSFNAAIRKGVLSGPPVISTQPQSQSVSAGGAAQFSVVVSSVASYTCQWNLNGSAIAGATGTSYSIASASSSNAGDYTVVVNNGVGSVTSNKATLTITNASSPSSQSSSGGGGGSIGLALCAGLGLLGLLRRALAAK